MPGISTGEEHYFEKDGSRYYVIRYAGKRNTLPPVVLVHGLLMDPRFWHREHVALFQEFADVYAISLAGHYPSVFPDGFSGPVDRDFIIRMIDDQLAEMGLADTPVVLVGHSSGALSALVYAIGRPDSVAALGVLSTPPHGRETMGMYSLFQSFSRKWGAPGRWLFGAIQKANSISPGVHRHLLGDVAYDRKKMFAYPGFDEWIASYFPHNVRQDSASLGLWLKDLHDIDVSDELHTITQPTLLVFSRNDPYVPPETMKILEQGLTQSSQVTARMIPQSGHLYMFESSEEFSGIVGDRLRSLEQARREDSRG